MNAEAMSINLIERDDAEEKNLKGIAIETEELQFQSTNLPPLTAELVQ